MTLASRHGVSLALTALAILFTGAAGSAATTSLTGGTVTLKVPAGETTPAFSFTNTTGVPICDMVVSRGAGGWNINGCVVDDPQHTDEDWDADDNDNGSFDAGESTAAPGAGGEGAGGAALGHADNTQATPDGKIRVQENGADADNEARCVGNNRNFQVTCQLSGAALDGDTLVFQPTNVRDANICAATSGLLGQIEKCAITPDRTITPAFALFGRDIGVVNSVTVKATGIDGTALIVNLESNPKGIVNLRSGTITFQPPLNAERGLAIYGQINDYAVVEFSVEGKRTQAPVLSAENPD